MNKTEMLALLNKWGVTPPTDATDDQLKKLVGDGPPTATANSQTSAPPATASAPADAATAARITALENQLRTANATRVTDQFNAIAATRPHVAENRETFLANCLRDESFLSVYSAFPEVAAPLNVSRAPLTTESSARKAINEKTPGKDRFNFIRDNWHLLNQGGIPFVYNANTTDAALTTDMLASGLIVVLQNRLAPLSAFTRDFGTDRFKPLAKVQVPIATSGGTAQTNATDFEDTTNFVGTVDNVEITLARITSGAHLTPSELNSGFRMAQFMEIKAHELADKIQNLVNAIITTANFDRTTELGTPALVAAEAAFGHDELSQLWAAISKSSMKNIMLSGKAYSRFLPRNLEEFNPLAGGTLPGWDVFALNTYWTGATAATYGFACNPQAIAVASGLPLASPNRNRTTLSSSIALPGIGLVVEQQEWYSDKTKTDWMNWEVMFGASKGDGSAGALVKGS